MGDGVTDDRHATAAAAVVAKLRADDGVQALAGEDVFDGAAPDGATLPNLVVRCGRKGKPAAGEMLRHEVKVEGRAATEKVLAMLMTAVHHALDGQLGGAAFRVVTLAAAGRPDDDAGTEVRTDVYTCCLDKTAAAAGRAWVTAAPPTGAEPDRPTGWAGHAP